MPRKKTKEEYVEQLKIKNPYVELVGDYIDDHTKVQHRCNKHNVLWDISPNKALQGRGCKTCGREKYRDKRGKPESQYIEELAIRNPTIKLRGEYMGTNTPVEHYCETHNILFNIRPGDALYGKGCRMCKSDKLREKLLKPEEEYIKELAEKNPNAKLVGEYRGIDVATDHLCLIHNIVWTALPHNVLYGKGCSQCRSEKIRTRLLKPLDEYVDALAKENPDLELIGEYINYNTPTEHHCHKHDVSFDISPMCALLGHGCYRCTSEKCRDNRLKSEEQYIVELREKHPKIVLCSEYVGGNINTLHECLVCGCEWMPRPSNLLTGHGCPECSESKGEQQVSLWLKNKGFVYVPQKKFDDCCDKRPLPFDFYLPEQNICIEYQGKQHYEAIEYFGGEASFLYTKYHDGIKEDYCLSKKITLICIPYWEDVNEYLNENLLI
jgi:hypothetical protein